MSTDSLLHIEVVAAMPDRQQLVSIRLSEGATVTDAINESGIAAGFPEIEFDTCSVGIWGQPAARDKVLRNNDRVEIYRPLETDPREARRQLALLGQTMGKSATD